MPSRLLAPILFLLSLAPACASAPVPGDAAPPDLASATCSEAPAPVRPRVELAGCSEAPAPPMVRHKVFHQLRYHQSFPTDRAGLLASIRAHAELGADEIAWIDGNLPAGAYASEAAVMRRLFPGAPSSSRSAPITLAQR